MVSKASTTEPSSFLASTLAASPPAKASPSPGRSRLVGRAKDEPAPAAQIADQQRLDRDVLTAGRAAAHALQSRRDHPGVVEDQQVAAAQQARQIAHVAVVQAVGRDIEKPRRIPRSDRALGDEVVGKIEVEEIDAHGARV